MKRLIIAFGLLAGTVVVSCLGHSSFQANNYWMMGTWKLQTLNGAALPYPMQASGSDTVHLTNDIFTGTDHGTFSEAVTTRSVKSGQVATQTSSIGGSYALDGTNVTLEYGNSTVPRAGTVSQSMLTIRNIAGSYVYTR